MWNNGHKIVIKWCIPEVGALHRYFVQKWILRMTHVKVLNICNSSITCVIKRNCQWLTGFYLFKILETLKAQNSYYYPFVAQQTHSSLRLFALQS